MKPYWTSIEFSIPAPGKANFKGGFMYAFLPAIDVLDAIPKIKTAIQNETNYQIEEIEFLAIYEEIPWENEIEQQKYDELSALSLKEDKVVFDSFYLYENK